MAKKDETKEIEEKMQHLENQLKRAVADYQNLEKRIQDDSSSIVQYARSEMISRILPVLDSLDQAIAGASQSEAESGWLKGVMMAVKQLRQVLADEGLIEIETTGKFDPRLHEAVEVREGENDAILEVAQRGYTLNGKVVRPARVVVGKSNPTQMSEEAEEEIETEES